MRKQKINPTAEFISKQNMKSKEILSKLDLSTKNESSENTRKNIQLCQACFYSPPKLVMNAFFETNCCYCDVEMRFPNSDTEVSCQSCAKEEDVCKKCSAQID